MIIGLAVRGIGVPPTGRITEIAIAAADDEGVLLDIQSWKVARTLQTQSVSAGSSLYEANKAANMAALIALEAEAEGDTLAGVTQELQNWWDEEVGIDRFSADKPLLVGFRPDVSLEWFRIHAPVIEELFGTDRIDVLSLLGITMWGQPHAAVDIGENASQEVEYALDNLRWFRDQLAS